MQQPMPNPEDTSDLTNAMNMALDHIAKALMLNKTIPTTNNQRSSSNPSITQIAQPGEFAQNLSGKNAVQNGNGNGINGNPIRCYNYRGDGHYASNCTQASTSGTQIDKAPVYDSYRSAKGTVDQHPATVEETHAYFESLYNNLTIEVEKVNTVNRKLRETNVDLTTELA
ncbi:retrovirus-related pol polyprotein from transposon TNT 1-94 [Tanacetum coccineum]